MTDDIEELLEYLLQIAKERDQLKADLQDAKQAISGIRAQFRMKLDAARLVSACDDCPKLKEDNND